MGKAKILGNYSGKDIELCRTTNTKAGNLVAAALLEAQIPFTKNCKRIPFFRRDDYSGAEQMWVIRIHPHLYSRARGITDHMDYMYRKRLVLTNF